MAWEGSNALPLIAVAREPDEPYGPSGGASTEPPAVALRPYTREALWRIFLGGEPECDELELRVVKAARSRGGLALRIGQGLRELRKGRRALARGFRFPDYCREIGLGRSRGYELCDFAEALETRPILREAVQSGAVKYRAAQEVMPVAVGAAEECWTRKAATTTVRALAKEVARLTDPHAEEPWFRMVASIEPPHRQLLDEALGVAGRLLPHASVCGRYEALAQEYLGEFPSLADERVEGPVTKESWREDAQRLRPIFRRVGLRAEIEEQRAARLEGETERWAQLPAVPDAAAEAVDFASMSSPLEIDRELRRLVDLDKRWDDVIAHHVYTLQEGGVLRIHGFASTKQYVEERLHLPWKPIEKRVRLEERIWASPVLQEGRKLGLGFERLWLLSFLEEEDRAELLVPAKRMTVIGLRRFLDHADDERMRGQGKVKVFLPRSVAYLLDAAMETARRRVDVPLSDGECLAIIAAHFLRTYADVLKRRLSLSQRVRQRDGGWCTAPGCSAHSDDAHHIEFKSQGGHPTAMFNQTGGCKCHHVCVHELGLRVTGKAPDELVWTLDGEPFTGM
jgi:hypothetical protein